MGSVTHYLEVNAPADQCYSWWRGLTNLPQIMPDVEEVTPKDGGGGHSQGRQHARHALESARTARQERRVGRHDRGRRAQHPHRLGDGGQQRFRRAIEAATPGTGTTVKNS